MKKRSDSEENWESQREKIIGLGERSLRKTYYPELQQKLDELERFRYLLDQSNDFIFLLHVPSRSFIYVNDSACRQLGCSRQEFLALPWDSFFPEDAVARARELFDAGLEQGWDRDIITTRMFKCSGGELPVEINIRLVAFHKELYGVAVARNITERKLAEDALQKLNEELEMRVSQRTEELNEILAEQEAKNVELQKAYHELAAETAERVRILEELRQKEQLLIQQSRLAAMGEMLGNIAHQWRQPLNVLGLKVQELGLSYKHGSFSEELLNDNIAKAMEIVQHLSQTINVFQDLLKSNKGKMSFKVDQVIVKTVGLIEENFKNQNISIEISSTGNPQINGYLNEYGQVLLNLLTNARDAFLEHGVTDARITVRSWAENFKAVVTITDNAGGIKEEILDKVFDAYFTTKELGKGTGVGLFMSKMIVEKSMGGRLSVRNVEGGAEFRIEV